MSKTTDPTILTKPTLAGASTTGEAALAFAEGTTVPAAAPAAPDTTAPAAVPTGSNRAFFAPDGYRRLTINLPEALHKKLRMAAVERDCTATKIIEALLLKELGGSGS